MRLRKAVLFGLAIGFAVGGRVPHWAKAAPFDTSEEQSTSRGPGVALPHPAPLPAVVYPDLLPQDAIRAPRLPTIVTPSAPGKTGKAGTGFFIASDGTLLTAAHVVTGCARTEVVSPYVKPTKVQLLATDQRQDIALLRAFHLRPPAILALGGPASRRMFVLGYPASAGPIIPAETWATLENDKFPRPVLGLSDPRETIWIEADAVTHGYSGGPILDPDTGAVVGIVRGMVDTRRMPFLRGMPTAGVSIGPGAGRLAAFVRHELPSLDATAPLDTGDAALDDARRATVHVICWQ